VPFHSWLPDAGVAPSPVTALLHAAVLVKIGCYVYARLFIASFGVESFWHVVVPAIAGFSAIVSAGAAIVETDIKRIIAYSTISQLGFIILGLSIGTPLGVAGGLIYILMHGLSKGGLFLCAGIVEQRTHVKDVNKLGGLIEVMPLTAAAFVVCSFSIMGIPPLGGFFGKFMVIAGTVNSGQMWTAAIFIFGAILTMIYLFRAFNLVFLGSTKLQGSLSSFKAGSSVMVFSVVLLAVLSLAGGVFFNYPSEFVLATVKQMMGQ
jgi:formate hydrogenlyase subunit 3/multisubunit Na+/H+ antiporter MnhD subunit